MKRINATASTKDISDQLEASSAVTFDSIATFVRLLHPTEISNYYDSQYLGNKGWYGTHSYAEAEQKIQKGDDALAKMLRGSEKLDIHIPSNGTRRIMKTGVTGFACHVPNWLANVPNQMIYAQEQKVSKKVITVIYSCNTWSGETTENIAKVSARVMSCVMSLERKGYRVQLYASNFANKSSRTTGFVVKLKDAGQHIDTLKIAFPLLSSAWNRRFGFRFREMCGWHGVGSSLDGDELRRTLNEAGIKYDVALSYYDAKNIRTVEELEKLFINNTNKK